MYAITSTSYRAIANTSSMQPGETAVDILPESMLTTLQAANMRRQRDALITSCDWTQATDSPLNASIKAAWATYRQELRDVPAQSGFPVTINWPVAP